MFFYESSDLVNIRIRFRNTGAIRDLGLTSTAHINIYFLYQIPLTHFPRIFHLKCQSGGSYFIGIRIQFLKNAAVSMNRFIGASVCASVAASVGASVRTNVR